MTIQSFNQLSEEVRLAYITRVGTYQARRWNNVHFGDEPVPDA
jgi:hypothetical protein